MGIMDNTRGVEALWGDGITQGQAWLGFAAITVVLGGVAWAWAN